jgi:hypothetical protein
VAAKKPRNKKTKPFLRGQSFFILPLLFRHLSTISPENIFSVSCTYPAALGPGARQKLTIVPVAFLSPKKTTRGLPLFMNHNRHPFLHFLTEQGGCGQLPFHIFPLYVHEKR